MVDEQYITIFGDAMFVSPNFGEMEIEMVRIRKKTYTNLMK